MCAPPLLLACVAFPLASPPGQVIRGVGGLDHGKWREFQNDRTVLPARNFVDGDLIEHFLDLSRAHQEQACKALNEDGNDSGGGVSGVSDGGEAAQGGGEHTVESLLRIVEEMHRMH